MTTPTDDLLRRVRARLTPEGAWTKDAVARNQAGRPVKAEDPFAASWALSAAAYLEGIGSVRLSSLLRPIIGRWSAYVYVWNDAPERTHAEVLDALDRAILAEETR